MQTDTREATQVKQFREQLRALPEWQRFEESPDFIMDLLNAGAEEFASKLGDGPGGFLSERGIQITELCAKFATLAFDNRPESVEALIHLANLECERKGLDVGIPIFERALCIQEKYVGKLPYSAMEICGWAGSKLRDAGRLDEAAHYFKRGLKHAPLNDTGCDTRELAAPLVEILRSKNMEAAARRIEKKYLPVTWHKCNVQAAESEARR